MKLTKDNLHELEGLYFEILNIIACGDQFCGNLDRLPSRIY